jgi:hypothetical protein
MNRSNPLKKDFGHWRISMKRLILIIIVFCLIFANLFAAQVGKGGDEGKYWNTVSFRFMGTLNMDLFAGFDFNTPSLKQEGSFMLEGYSFGTGIFIRPLKFFDVFADINYHRTKFLVGKAGEVLTGPWVNVVFGTPTSPPLDNDTYYHSSVFFLRPGIRLIYPKNKKVEPWFGVSYGFAIWEVSFGSKDQSKTYSDIVTGDNSGFTLLAGTDFHFYDKKTGKRLMTFGLFFDWGRVLAAPLHMDNLFWDGCAWDSEQQTPGIPAFRFGVSLGM